MNKLRVIFKRWLSQVAVVIEFCRDCGRQQPLVWHADNALWALLTDQPNTSDMPGVLCPECFDQRANALGLSLYWIPEVEYIS